jgi:hypothetical protein
MLQRGLAGALDMWHVQTDLSRRISCFKLVCSLRYQNNLLSGSFRSFHSFSRALYGSDNRFCCFVFRYSVLLRRRFFVRDLLSSFSCLQRIVSFCVCNLPRHVFLAEQLRQMTTNSSVPWRERLSASAVISVLGGPISFAYRHGLLKTDSAAAIACRRLERTSSEAAALLCKVAQAEALDGWRLAHALAHVSI